MKLGITQRVENVSQYKERRDCLDQNWFVFFEKIGLNVVPIPNNLATPISFIQKNNLRGFVLSGGNDISSLPQASNPAPERDRTENLILEYAYEEKLPVLGVCRGFQLMNVFLNGELMLSEGHSGKPHKVIPLLDKSTFSTYKSVNSYHNYVVPKDKLGDGLKPVLVSSDSYVEAVQHNKLPWLGIMWHPEREKPFSPSDIALFREMFA